MEIIGKQDADTYLCKMTEREIALCMGFTGPSDEQYKRAKNNWRGDGLPVGTNVAVARRADAITSMQWKERQAQEGADALEALAKIMRGAMPSNFFTLPAEAAAPVEPKGD